MLNREPVRTTVYLVRNRLGHRTRFLTPLVIFAASYGKKYNEGPWARDTVHQIKGGKSRKLNGNLKATEKQLRYLAILGYTGSTDLTRYQASDIIEHLKRKRRT